MRAECVALPAPEPLADSGPISPRALSENLLPALSHGEASAKAKLVAGKALVVVTGQQPSFPLPLGLTLQKAATAVALAASLGKSLGLPVFPLFWNGTDDSDFTEAQGQDFARPGQAPIRVQLPAAAERRAAFVGDLLVSAAWLEVAQRLGMPPELEPAPEEDLGGLQGRILAQLFAPWGLLVLDARSPALRIAGRGLFLRYAERREAFAAALDATGDRIEGRGGERPLRQGLGERALYFLRARRRNIPLADVYGGQLIDKINSRPQDLSPNAALRPILQDSLLPVAAAVLGPGEWDYHRQLRPCFELLDVEFPAAWPRLRASWAGDEEAGLLDEGRSSSPLARADHPLAVPATLVELAGRHLAAWRAGKLNRWTVPAGRSDS